MSCVHTDATHCPACFEERQCSEIAALREQLRVVTADLNTAHLDAIRSFTDTRDRLAESRASVDVLTERLVELQGELKRAHEALDRRDYEIHELDTQNRKLTERLRSERGVKCPLCSKAQAGLYLARCRLMHCGCHNPLTCVECNYARGGK